MNLLNVVSLIKAAGYFGIFSIIFAESGLLVGFFLPGDSLLFTAGFLASQGYLNIWFLLILVFVGAVLGDNVGYLFGKKIGPHLFNRPHSFLFNKHNIEKAQAFFDKHGRSSIIIARFIPVIRTFTPVLAGVATMKYAVFFAYNIIGGFLWGVGICLLGFFLGNTVPDIDQYLLPIILVIIGISILPGLIHYIQYKRIHK